MDILLINQDWFAAEFREAGHRVVTVGLASNMELRLDRPLYHLNQILEQIGGGFQPDIIILHDNSAPLTILDIDEAPCPTIFYAVDTHHHTELHCFLSTVFDLTLVAQKDYVSAFEKRGLSAPEWMPLWASSFVEPNLQKHNQAVFVGTLNARLNPDRVTFFEKLKSVCPALHVTSGAWQGIFPESEIVINQTVKGDLNFRVFEAMICGAALLTEDSGNGLRDLFEPDKELVLYEKNNAEAAAAKIDWLLNNPKQMRRIAEAGRAAVMTSHLSQHRAQRFLEIINGIKKKERPLRRMGAMLNLAVLAARLATLDSLLSVKALTECMCKIGATVDHGDTYSEEAAFYAVRVALEYDRVTNSDQGMHLLNQLYDQNPDLALFRATKIRHLLNNGRVNEAREFAAHISEIPVEEVFKSAEEAVSIVISAIRTEEV